MVAVSGRSATMEDVQDTIASDSSFLPADSSSLFPDSSFQTPRSSHSLLVAAEVAGINGLIMTYNWLFRRDEGFSHVTINTVQRNLTHKHWWWDEDYFRTNTLEHPFHGSLFYLTARVGGMSVAESSLYTVGGSWMWEMVGESEMPSINDMVYTIAGGIALGEPLYRVASYLISRTSSHVLRPPLTTHLSLGYRAFDAHQMPFVRTASLTWHSEYGDMMGDSHGLFDYFDLNVTANIGNHQSPVSLAQVDAQLYSHILQDKPLRKVMFGIYNHFDYFCALPYYNGNEEERERNPFVYSEVAAVGPSFAYRLGNRTRLEQQLSLSAIPMGVVSQLSSTSSPDAPSSTSHASRPPHSGYRGYSFGSGYGVRLSTRASVRQWLNMRIDTKMSHLFTWDGFYEDSGHRHEGERSVQGERGNAVTFVFAPVVELFPWCHWGISCGARYLATHANYHYHPHSTMQAWEWQAGLSWRF